MGYTYYKQKLLADFNFGIALALRAAKTRMAIQKGDVHFVRSAGLGDVLMTTPLLRAAKKMNPRGRVSIYTNFPELLRGLPYVDHIGRSEEAPPEAQSVRYEELAQWWRWHLAKAMGLTVGVRVDDTRPDCVIDRELATLIKSTWNAGPHILIQRHASHWTPNKDWPDAHWLELVAGLVRRGTVIEIGEAAPSDAAFAYSNYIDRRGQATLKNLVATISAADLIIGPVSGQIHIAAAAGTPAVVILGGYERGENTAYPGNITLCTQINCSPCWLRTPCPIDRQCLRQITSNEVLRAVDEQLQKLHLTAESKILALNDLRRKRL